MIRAALRNCLLVLVLVCVTGGQWAVLQSAAWAMMLLSNLQKESVPQAVATTFDGQHPCPLCKAIAEGKKSEKKTEFEPKMTRFEFIPVDHEYTLTSSRKYAMLRSRLDRLIGIFSTEPTTPPPRAICA